MSVASRGLRSLAVVTFALLTACGLLAQVNTAAGDFTLVLFPDTQNEAQYYPQVLSNQVQWVVNNRTAWNIKAVLGLGDIVNDGASTSQQQNADAAIKLLDNAKLPYLLAIGNHDYDGANTGASTRTATGFNTWWGPQRYAGYSWYKGNLDGSNENFWGELAINGKNYLFMMLEYVPRTTSLDWAASVIQAHPSDEVIVVTHSFMFYDNTRVDQCDTNDLNRDNPGDKNWAYFASKYPNISMVVSGHITTGLAGRRADLGVNGNLVNQMLSNYQVLSNGGDGWIRLLTFHPGSNTVNVKTYSPYLNSYKTDSKNQFTIYWHNPHLTTGSSTITGRVTSSCAAVAGAKVSTGAASTTTDTTGRYSLTVSPGTYNLSISASGYNSQAQSIKAWDGYGPNVDFYLTTTSGGTTTGVGLSPTSLTFGSQAVGTTSTAQTITFKNGTASTVSITGAGANGDFKISSFACPTSLAAGASCNTSIVFKPTTTGTRSGTFTIGVSTGNQTASLTGTGGTSTTSGSVALTPSSLTYPSTNVGGTSSAQNVILSNGTTAAVSITSVLASGDFAVSSNACGTSLAAGGSCAIGVVFKPSASGTRTGTLAVSDSAGTQSASLTGTGATTTSGGGSTGGTCTQSGTSPVTICTPAANSTVSSPVLVAAVAVIPNPIKVLQIYVNGSKVYEIAASSLSTSVPIAAGSNQRLTVQAIDSLNLTYKSTIYINVQ